MDRVLAIAVLRFRLLLHRSRGVTGAAKLAAAAIMAVFAAGLAIGIAVGFAFLVHFAVTTEQASGIRTVFLVIFYTFFVFGVILPVLSGAMNPGFDASPLRVFPIAHRKLYAITLGANFFYSEHLLYYPALLAVGVTGVLIPGTHVFAGLAVLCLALVFYVVWANAMATLVPLVAERVKIDPAVVSTPMITTIVDASGMLIYLSLAALVLQG